MLLPSDTPTVGPIILQALAFLFVAIFTHKAESIGANLSKILNVVALALIFLPIIKIISQEIEKPKDNWTAASVGDGIKAPIETRPNIIHIVLDGYTRSDVLKKLYGYDNSDFEKSLRDFGFVIADKTIAPFSETIFSMNSIFEMNYINDPPSKFLKGKTAEEVRRNLEHNLKRPLVVKFLRSMGYETIAVESIYQAILPDSPKHIIFQAKKQFQLSYFEKEVFQYTPISIIIDKFSIVDDTYGKVKFQLAKHDFNEFKSPYFVYNHILAPHPPFNIDSNGRYQLDSLGIRDGVHRELDGQRNYLQYRIGYIEKLKFTNQAILDKIFHLQQHIANPKIIIIHSDHGGALYLDQENKANTCLKERFSSFLAIYSSDVDLSDAITNQINLVNLYRTIFTRVFGQNYSPLESRSYFVPWSNPERLEAVGEVELNSYGPMCTEPSLGLPN
jgi:hypothetical protein